MRPTWDDIVDAACSTGGIARMELARSQYRAPAAVSAVRYAIAGLCKRHGLCSPREAASRMGVARTTLMYGPKTRVAGAQLLRYASELLAARLGTVDLPTSRAAQIVYSDLLMRNKRAFRPSQSTGPVVK